MINKVCLLLGLYYIKEKRVINDCGLESVKYRRFNLFTGKPISNKI